MSAHDYAADCTCRACCARCVAELDLVIARAGEQAARYEAKRAERRRADRRFRTALVRAGVRVSGRLTRHLRRDYFEVNGRVYSSSDAGCSQLG